MDLNANLSNGKVKGFMGTPKGKGLALGLLLILIALVALLVMTFAFPKSDVQPVSPVPKPAGTNPNPAPAAQSQSTDTATSDTETVPKDADLTNFRDPFKPLAILASSTDNSGSQESTSTSTSISSAIESLSLVSITEQNGEKYATFNYKGTTYMVKEGERIADSEFQVIDIGEGSVTLLYGDSLLTLQVGDEIIK